MDSRIPFDSPVWQEDKYAIAALEVLRGWERSKPSVDEFVNFVESNTCSDCTYESFYYILPYVVDELECRPADEQFRMVSMLDWKLLKAVEAKVPDRCYDQLSACENQIVSLLTAMNRKPGCPTEVIQYNLGAIAALQGDPELGEEIMSRGE